MRIHTVAILVVSAAIAALVGCTTGGSDVAPRSFDNVSYTLAAGRTFDRAVNTAAVRRRWTPQALDNGTYRCSLIQREHRVVVDIVPAGPSAFSVRAVESNIPAKKYNQWVDNLVREIVMQAAR